MMSWKVVLPQPDAGSPDCEVAVLVTPDFMVAGMPGAVNVASIERKEIAPDNDVEAHRDGQGGVRVDISRAKAKPNAKRRRNT